MSYVFIRDFEGAFQVDHESLQRLCSIISHCAGGDVTVHVSFDDDVNMTYDAGPLESHHRIRYQVINRLRLKQKDWSAKNSCEVTIRKSIDSGNISLNISGDPDICDRCRLEIVAEIERMRTGQNWFYKKVGHLRKFAVFMFQYGLLFVFWMFFVARFLGSLNLSKELYNSISGIAFFVAGILPGVTMYIIEKAALKYYSPMVFLFGKGADLQRAVEKRRSLFWGVVLIPIVINIITPSIVTLLHGDQATDKQPPTVSLPPAKAPDTNPNSNVTVPSRP